MLYHLGQPFFILVPESTILSGMFEAVQVEQGASLNSLARTEI
jgi:hypothetical protein